MAFVRSTILSGLTALSLIAAPLRAGAADQVTVFAAAALTNALDAVAERWQAETGHRVLMSYAGSSALARQIEGGAPADIFISASVDWMDALDVSGDLRAGTRRDILGTRLVLIAHGQGADAVSLDESLDLLAMLDGGKLSMSLVDAVPSGVYGRAALESLGLWEAVAPQVVQSYNVRSALAFVAMGEAPLGIVYATDAVVEDNVSVIGTFPETSHPPIILPAAITAQSRSPVAEAFLDFMNSEPAREIWADHGFELIE